MPSKTKDYDNEPVQYCSKCYSLRIMHDDTTDNDVCAVCGSTDIDTTTIDIWERMYENRYGHKFVSRSNNPRDSIYFKMPIAKLKVRLYNNKYFEPILRSLYPHFPKGLSRTDSIIMLFDQLSKDNRIDELRYMLYDYSKK